MSTLLAGITTPVYAHPAAAAAPRRAPNAPPVAARPPSVAASTAEEQRGFRDGVKAERRRWATVLASAAFGSQPVAGAHLLASTDLQAGEIVATLRQVAADAAAAPAARQQAIADRWAAAFNRMEAAAGDGPRPSRDIDGRWSAAMKRAGVV